MVKTLKIKNIALIEESKIDFNEGFNILTGETGAGKSIIIDALNFVLGAKADKSLIKNGCDFSLVEGTFSIDEENQELENLFNDFNLEYDSIIKISRTMTRDSKNECRINGELVSLGMLKKITTYLVDIFGQHDNFILLDPKNHLELLDSLCGKDLVGLKEELKEKLDDLKEINGAFKEFGGTEESRAKEIELLEFEINQIEEANLKIDEEDKLTERKTIILNSEKIFESLKSANEDLIYNQDIQSFIKSAINSLNNVKQYDSELESVAERLTNIRYELIDVCEILKDKQNNSNYSEAELNEIEERLDLIKGLKRKFGKNIEEIFTYLENAKSKLEKLNNCNEELEKLNKRKKIKLKEIFDNCASLTNLRKKYAFELKEKILKELKDLGMKNANFEVAFLNEYNEESIEKNVSEVGADKVEFLFSANLGEPVKSLSKIISGGELSRFSLAIKCIVRNSDKTKTFVFDEIDTGIGGAVGSIIAKKISKIAKTNQVLCITHLAQIASFADSHYKITKFEDNERTYTNVKLLDNEEQILEITRMIGTMENEEFAKLHANKLLEESLKYKQNLNNF